MSKYNYSSPFQSAPAYSFGRNRNRLIDRKVPGPGAYEQKVLMNSQGFKFDHQNREVKRKSQSLGPGQYQYDLHTFSHEKGVIDKASKERRMKGFDVGPGQYY